MNASFGSESKSNSRRRMDVLEGGQVCDRFVVGWGAKPANWPVYEHERCGAMHPREKRSRSFTRETGKFAGLRARALQRNASEGKT
ncbi:hypothetical protein FE772_00875 [Lysobacter enzymogenes]|nr:hypothetical protein [Lysobacter enzymogenes]QCW24437.1 hypothetical protein FE772_00875 [Lysobacter enzymogenes]